MTGYLTVARSASVELEIKRSRFRADIVRVDTEEAARAVIDAARREHWDARHHCSAWVLGPRSEWQRSSDDGEPAGTAGAPMLSVLRGAGVSDVVAVVTRWFGGVLLGAGGLVRAYGDAVREGLVAAGTLERKLLQRWSVAVPLAEVGRVEAELRGRGVVVLAVDYDATQASVVCALAASEVAGFEATIAATTSGQGRPVFVSEDWVDVASTTP